MSKESPEKLTESERFSNLLKDFRKSDSSPATFKKLGYPAWAVKVMGYTIEELKEGGYSAIALKRVGFSKEDVDRIFKI